MLDSAAEKGADKATDNIMKLLNLDNGIPQAELFDTSLMEGDSAMAKRIRKRVDIEGQTYWVSGCNEADVMKKVVLLARETAMDRVANSAETTFQEYAETWYSTYKERQIGFREKQNYKTIFHKHLFPFFDGMKLSDVTTEDIQKFFNLKDDEGYKSSTIHKMDVVIKQVFRSAVEDELIVRNPSDSKRLTYNKKATKREALSMADAKELFKALGQLKKYEDRLLIAIPIFIGTRRGETLALRWENIDWDNSVIHIREAVSFENGRPRLGEPKSESGIRDIPFDSRLEAMLKPIRKDSGFIIGDGDIPITECTYRSAWKRIKRTIDVKKFTAHNYRHTFITFGASSGIDVKTLQGISGHADASTTMNHYAHQRKDILHDAGNQMDAVFSEIG